MILPRSLDARYSYKFLAIIIINGAPLLAGIIVPITATFYSFYSTWLLPIRIINISLNVKCMSATNE